MSGSTIPSRVIRVLADARNPMTTREVARLTGATPDTVRYVLATIAETGQATATYDTTRASWLYQRAVPGVIA